MASSINPLSSLYSSATQSTATLLGLPSTTSTDTNELTTGVSATAETQAMLQQGNFASALNNSIAVALLQPSSALNSGFSPTTLVNNLLQQVIGAYQAQSPSQTVNST